MTIWSASFWKAATERAVRAFASTLASTWVVGGTVLDLRGVDWGSSLSVAGGAALVSLLLSVVAGVGVGPAGSPSFVADPAAAGAPAAGFAAKVVDPAGQPAAETTRSSGTPWPRD